MFALSTDIGSPRHTSRILRPLLRWLNPNVSEETLQAVQFAVRKTAHITEYAVFALLVWWARRKSVRGDPRPWNRSDAVFVLGVVLAYAATDEWHQSFIPSREGRVTDVLIDFGGAVVGLSLLWVWGRWRKRR
jgi:VanZ family protein